jgi:hypothetical protein
MHRACEVWVPIQLSLCLAANSAATMGHLRLDARATSSESGNNKSLGKLKFLAIPIYPQKGSVMKESLRKASQESKLAFRLKQPKSWERKCPGDPSRSIVELPAAISFLRISWKGVLQHPRLFTATIPEIGGNQGRFDASMEW